MTIELDGIRLFYEKSGEGKPLLLIHGNGEDHTIFDKTIALLEKKYCCYVFRGEPDCEKRGMVEMRA